MISKKLEISSDVKSDSRLKRREKKQSGFTLMEIVVATTIFTIAVVALLSLFNYVLKINRRSQALAQASQGMRNFIEFLAKEIQGGQIDYYVVNGSYVSGVGPCVPPRTVGTSVAPSTPSTYSKQENKLGIINTDGLQECIYYSQPNGTAAGSGVFDSSGGANSIAVWQLGAASAQIINPPNFKIDNLMFLIRPICDPYTATCTDYSTTYPSIQPYVTIIVKFTASLPTGEKVPIYYQTSVSSNKYDIPQN
jgi:prepilin-type N-terminal cleavage/methylation domain-containing protein